MSLLSASTGTTATTTPPNAPAAAPPAVAHTWLTSRQANARRYYCDDDPARSWLAPDRVEVFASAAELLAKYPDRRLHRPCLDGTTGP
jgi:hypothetical protein